MAKEGKIMDNVNERLKERNGEQVGGRKKD